MPMSAGFRRRRWGLWIGLMLLVLLVTPILLYFAWGRIDEYLLRRELAALRAAGEPVAIAALAPAPAAGGDNGYVPIRSALALLSSGDHEDPFRYEEPQLPLFDDERVALRAWVESQRPAREAMKQAIGKPVFVADDLKFESPGIRIEFPDLKGLRGLATAARRASIYEFDRGRHDLALEEIRVIEPLARGGASHVSLVGAIMAIGCRVAEVETVFQIAPGLQIGAEPGTATPEQVREAIARLLDSTEPRRELVMAMKAERAFQLDIMQCIADGSLTLQEVTSSSPKVIPATGSSKAMIWVSRPLLWSSARFSLDFMGRTIAQLGAPDWPTAKARLAPLEQELMQMGWRQFFSRLLMPSVLRAVQTHYRSITDRHLAATALAIRMYAVDHDGRLPAELDDLVPVYLPAVPIDPMSGGRLQYRRDAELPMIWSVGEDGADDGGSEAPGQGARGGQKHRWQTQDVVVPLQLPPRERSVLAPD